ncbi:hypothetical protein KFL_000700310, partial [Klebsormidium nitens]
MLDQLTALHIQVTLPLESLNTPPPKPSTSYHPKSPPENARVPARTARRRARKKEAAQNPQITEADNQLTDPVEWVGLVDWRAKEVDESRGLGKKGPEAGVQSKVDKGEKHEFVLADSLAECGRQVLQTRDPALKSSITHAAYCAYKAGKLPIGEAIAPATPARPDKPALRFQKVWPPPQSFPEFCNVHPGEDPPTHPLKAHPLPLHVYMLHSSPLKADLRSFQLALLFPCKKLSRNWGLFLILSRLFSGRAPRDGPPPKPAPLPLNTDILHDPPYKNLPPL